MSPVAGSRARREVGVEDFAVNVCQEMPACGARSNIGDTVDSPLGAAVLALDLLREFSSQFYPDELLSLHCIGCLPVCPTRLRPKRSSPTPLRATYASYPEQGQ